MIVWAVCGPSQLGLTRFPAAKPGDPRTDVSAGQRRFRGMIWLVSASPNSPRRNSASTSDGIGCPGGRWSPRRRRTQQQPGQPRGEVVGLAEAVADARAADVVLGHGDEFYGPEQGDWRSWSPEQGYERYFDHERLECDLLRPLRFALPAHFQRYDWANNVLDGWTTLEPQGIVLVEGVYLLRPRLRAHWDLRRPRGGGPLGAPGRSDGRPRPCTRSGSRRCALANGPVRRRGAS
jgi:hypothetical protein